jgi:hypothetical protein
MGPKVKLTGRPCAALALPRHISYAAFHSFTKHRFLCKSHRCTRHLTRRILSYLRGRQAHNRFLPPASTGAKSSCCQREKLSICCRNQFSNDCIALSVYEVAETSVYIDEIRGRTRGRKDMLSSLWAKPIPATAGFRLKHSSITYSGSYFGSYFGCRLPATWNSNPLFRFHLVCNRFHLVCHMLAVWLLFACLLQAASLNLEVST